MPRFGMRLLAGVVVGLGLCGARPASGFSLSCGDAIVRAGATSKQVLAKCGRPAYRDSFLSPVAPGNAAVRRDAIWYYDRGPHRLIDVLHFEGGTLVRIDTAGYGFARPPPRDCDPTQMSVGMTKYELLQRCGPPARKEVLGSGLWSPRGWMPSGAYRPSRLERWTYDFGSGWLPRVVEMRDDVVTKIEVPSGSGGDP